MPDVNCRTDGTPCVPRRRLHIKALEGRVAEDFSIGYGVHGASTGQREAIEVVLFVQVPDEMEERFLVYGLHRSRDVAVPVAEQLIRATRWPEKLLKDGRKERTDMRAASRPRII